MPASRVGPTGVLRLEQLTQFSETEVKQGHGIGPSALNQLRRALSAKELSFAHLPDCLSQLSQTGVNNNRLLTKSVKTSIISHRTISICYNFHIFWRYMKRTYVVSEAKLEADLAVRLAAER